MPGRERARETSGSDTSGRPDEPAPIRPYAVTGGRTRSNGELIPIEALVGVVARPAVPLASEKAQIIELALAQYLSIAELSAYLHLPVGVIRVLVGDLVEEGYARVHGAVATQYDPAATFSVLESVLNGISEL